MVIPDLSDTESMARVGRISTLYKARRKAAQELRDSLIPLLNSIEREGNHWDVSKIPDLVETIMALNKAIEEQ